MRVLIVEDETAASENLTAMLNQLDPTIEIMGNSESVQQTVRLLNSGIDPDLIFMDIQLSDGNSFAIFDQVKVDTPVIFTTAFDQYAINAFKVNSIDYLLKPIKVSELRQALEKFHRLSARSRAGYVQMLQQLSSPSKYKTRILITDNEDLIPVEIPEIAYIYTSDRKTSVHLMSGERYPCNITLEQFASMLDPELFIRANKQFILSRKAIKKLNVCFDSRILVTTVIETPEAIYISKNKASDFKAWMTR